MDEARSIRSYIKPTKNDEKDKRRKHTDNTANIVRVKGDNMANVQDVE